MSLSTSLTFKCESNAFFCKKCWTSANENDYYCLAIRKTLAENLKARHCSHCFQYYFSQPGAGFFFELGIRPGLLVILSPGSARAPHVHLVRSGPCALAVNKLTATPTTDLEASSFIGRIRQSRHPAMALVMPDGASAYPAYDRFAAISHMLFALWCR